MVAVRDGGNLYGYAGNNPITRGDPTRLTYDDSWLDDFIADRTGHALHAIATFIESARWASLGLQTAVGIAAGFLPGSGLYDAFESVQVIASGGGGFWDAVNIATAAFPVAKLAGEGFTALRRLSKARFWGFKACNCFVAGTEVTTSIGSVPIELVRVGDEVLTRHHDEPGQRLIPRRVTRVFRGVAESVVWLTLATGQVLGATPEHEVFAIAAERLLLPAVSGSPKTTYSDAGGETAVASGEFLNGSWTTVGALQPGDAMFDPFGQPVEVVEVRLDQSPTAIYNLEVEGTFTYFAQDVWVHNNSCTRRNAHLAGQTDPRSGVPFDEFGFPNFSKWAKADVRIAPTGNPRVDFAAANRAAGYAETPRGYTWHHHQDYGRMQLVPTSVHSATGHTGGASTWGGGY